MQIIRRHQQLQAQLRRNLHVRHVPLLPVLQVVAQVLAHLLQHHAATRRILRQLESSNVEWIFVRLFVCKGKDGGEEGGKGGEEGTLSSRACTGRRAIRRRNLCRCSA